MIGDGDLELIFESGDFDTVATFTISTTASLEVNGWFTGGSEAVNILTGEIEAVQPMFDCESSKLEETGNVVRKGMAVAIDGTSYSIERLQKLGNGVTTVYLKS